MEQKPSRSLIYKRDNHTCQYCGSTKKLTIDHVIPRSRGGKDTWENMVIACSSCNTKKGDQLLEHTKMKLIRTPKAPSSMISLDLKVTQVDQWKEYKYEV